MGLFDQPEDKLGMTLAAFGTEYALGEYSRAYWRAARAIIDRGNFRREERPNYDCFPVAFLYRHALELAVKSLLVQCQNATGIPTKDVLKRGHRLSQLIPDLRRLKTAFQMTFERVEAGGMTLADIEAVLLEWDRYDANAETFRYSMRKNGKPTLPADDFMIDLDGFSATMDAVLNFIFAVDGAVFDELLRGWSGTDSHPGETENDQR
jgi:hypothetical protein